MHSALRRRYARRAPLSRCSGLRAVGLSVLFLAFLLFTMASKGLGGFIQYEAALPIDFARVRPVPRSRRRCRGPTPSRRRGGRLEGAISQAAVARLRPATPRRCSAMRAVSDAGRDIVADPDMLNGTPTLWLPVGSKIDIAAKDEGDAASEQLVDPLKAKQRCAARSTPTS